MRRWFVISILYLIDIDFDPFFDSCTIALRKLLSCRQIWPGFESYFYSQVILQIYSGDFYLDMRGVIGNLFNVGAILTASRVILYSETVVMYINIIVYSIYLMTHLKLFWNGSYFETLEIYQHITDDELWELFRYLWFMAFDDLRFHGLFEWLFVQTAWYIYPMIKRQM